LFVRSTTTTAKVLAPDRLGAVFAQTQAVLIGLELDWHEAIDRRGEGSAAAQKLAEQIAAVAAHGARRMRLLRLIANGDDY